MIVGGLELFSSLEMILTEPELRLMIEIGHAASISHFANFLLMDSQFCVV